LPLLVSGDAPFSPPRAAAPKSIVKPANGSAGFSGSGFSGAIPAIVARNGYPPGVSGGAADKGRLGHTEPMPTTYALHQALFSFSGDAWIEDADDNRVFEVDGKAFALGRTLDLLDRDGTLLYTLHQRVLSFRPTFEISRGGAVVATLQKALLAFLGDRFTITLADGTELDGKGNFLDHEFTISRGNAVVAAASRAWFSMHDTYGVQVAEDFDDPLALAIVIAIEQLESEEDGANGAGLFPAGGGPPGPGSFG
jgi:uncharacterized protein YxjI